jgi:hypothetical protein
VEVKRNAGTRIRREVVGQLLDDAAPAGVSWTVEDVPARLRPTAPGAGATPGHNQVVLPEGDLALQEMNPPLTRALNGEIGVREALRESQDKVNVLFAKRPKEWDL